MEKKRQISFEILRVLAMLMVVAQHYWMYATTGRGVEAGQPASVVNYIFFQPFLIFCKGGVPLYIMISGYFLSVKGWSFNWKRVALIWFYTFLYSLLGCVLFIRVTPELATDIKSLLRNILPLIGNQYWFITDYIALAVFAPFLAKLSQILNRRQFTTLLFAILLFGMTFWFNFPFGNSIGISNGYSLLFFIFLYLIGGYIRKYDISFRGKYPAVIALGTVVASSLFCFIVESRAGGSVYVKFPRYNDLSVLVAVVFFIAVKDWNPRETWFCKAATRLAPYVLGVYLIHTNIYVREHLWHWVKEVTPPHDFSTWIAIPSAIIIPTMVFLACALIDFVVKRIIKVMKLEDGIGVLAMKMNALSDRIIQKCMILNAEQ